MGVWGHKSEDGDASGLLFSKRSEGGGCETFPFDFDEVGFGGTGVDEQSVTELEGCAWFDGVRVAESRGGSHPTIASNMKLDGVVEILGVIHERDAFVCGGVDGARVIDPAGGFTEALFFVDAAFGVGDASASVMDTDGFCHTDSEESEGGCSDGDGFFWCDEFGIDVDAPEVCGGEVVLV